MADSVPTNSLTEYAVERGTIDAASTPAPISPNPKSRPDAAPASGSRACGGVDGIVDPNAICMQRGRAGHDNEESDDACEDCTDRRVDVFKRRSATVSRLSATYDWMKLRPHGARVVPSVAVARTMASRLDGSAGTAIPRAVAPQSGCARIAAPMYERNTALERHQDVFDAVEPAPQDQE